MKKVTVKNVQDFNLDHIFQCGQCFRWEKEEDGSYTGIAFSKVVNFSFSQEQLTIDNATQEDYEKIWKLYLDMDTDYGQIKKELAKRDDTIKDALEYGYGIRILKQEKWETLVSFIISANNNIPRIKKNIEGLAERFGEKIESYRGKDYYNLPAPEVLAKLTVEDLAPIRLGYRANYLIKTAQMIVEEGRVSLENLNTYCGVGPKVANCISLFSMDQVDSFPIDTWVEKVMKELYQIEGKKEIATFAKEQFGELGGIAQQYLFYYMRDKN